MFHFFCNFEFVKICKMIKKFEYFVRKNAIFSRNDKILLAVSGGIDSMAMLYLFHQAGYNIGVAHCNFNLRGTESDGDKEFVEDLALQLDIPFYSVSFKTEEIAAGQKVSIQMAARDLRYKWFEEMRRQNGYDYVATAHNKNDVAETFLINLYRGTGIRGLTGIKTKNNRLIRPMLFATRKEIERFMTTENHLFREDSSNSQTKYARNKIRLDILPFFEELNPDFVQTIVDDADHLREAEAIYNYTIEEKRKLLLTQQIKPFPADKINIKKLLQLPAEHTFLYELLKPYHFSDEVSKDILMSLSQPAGKRFYSSTHRLIKDREFLIINPLSQAQAKKHLITADKEHYVVSDNFGSLVFDFKTISKDAYRDFSKATNTAYIDLETITYPLIIRKWESGDYFFPLGMKQRKKLSDFFIDLKMSVVEKESVWVMTSGGKVVWIVGKRIDERFKINDKTTQILCINIK